MIFVNPCVPTGITPASIFVVPGGVLAANGFRIAHSGVSNRQGAPRFL
jgi:hypothetical protein